MRTLIAKKLLDKTASEMTGGRFFETTPSAPTVDHADREEDAVKSITTKPCNRSALLQKVAATRLKKEISGPNASKNLHVDTGNVPNGVAAGRAAQGAQAASFRNVKNPTQAVDRAVKGSTGMSSRQLNMAVGGGGGSRDPLNAPLADRLAAKRQSLGLSAPGNKAQQIGNANAIRAAGPAAPTRAAGPNATAQTVNKALVDAKAGHQSALSFNQTDMRKGHESFTAHGISTAPVHAPPQSLAGRILGKIKNQAGSAAAHLRGKATSFIRSPLGKATAIGAGVIGAGALAHKAFGGKDEDQYYSQGY